MKLLGVIVEVNPKDLVISLPGGLRGFVRAEEVSDIPTDAENKVLRTHACVYIYPSKIDLLKES